MHKTFRGASVRGGSGPRRLQPLPRQEGVSGGEQAQARVGGLAVVARAEGVPRGRDQAQLGGRAATLCTGRAARAAATPSNIKQQTSNFRN